MTGTRWLLALAAVLVVLAAVLPARAAAEGAGASAAPPANPAPSTDDALSGLDTADIDRLLREAQANAGPQAPQVSVRGMLSALTSGRGFDWREMLRGLLRALFAETMASTALLAKLVALAVLAAVLHNVQEAFGGGGAARVAAMVCYLATVTLALSSFALAFGTARGAVDSLVTFMQALLPTLLALLAANGGVVTVPLLHPVMVATINLASVMVRDVALPLILVAALVDLISSFSSSYKLSGLASLLRYATATALSLAMVLVLGVSSALKASGPVADSVALRAGKFAASTFIPVVGKMFSDAAELVWGTSTVLMSAVGLAGAVGVVLVVAFPLVKLVAIILTYRLAGAVIQPVSDPDVVGLLNGVANSVALTFVAVAAVALLFFLGVTMLMGAGNALMGLRQL
ncbi:MAG: stage III sporulation protein AE [Bacillota bacterium]